MKRNESILVYSVTGLLVVILAVAILFGNERAVMEQAEPTARGLDDLGGVISASSQSPAPAETVPADFEAKSPPGPAASPGSSGKVVGSAPGGAADGGAGPIEAALSVKFDQPQPDPSKAGPGSGEVDPATQALVLLGDSRREGDYRIVTVRHSDTFSELVQRWCGGLDQLEVAESLNEDVDVARLEPGSKVCLPWVDDSVLVAAHAARKVKQDANSKVVAEARSKGQGYVVKAGDSLWSIAVQMAGKKGAPNFIERTKALNPELLANPDRLVVGKTIVLPK